MASLLYEILSGKKPLEELAEEEIQQVEPMEDWSVIEITSIYQ